MNGEEALVGPVLTAGAATDAVLRAIEEANEAVTVQDRGAYVRILVPGRCVLHGSTVSKHLGRPFELPGDLELIMPAFRGRFSVSQEQAQWEVGP